MNPERSEAATIERALRALAAATSASSALTVLIEESLSGAPRAALLLLRGGRIKGWGSNGYSGGASRSLEKVDLPAHVLWLGSATNETEIVRPAQQGASELGQGSFEDAVALPLRIGAEVVAVLLVERSREERPFDLAFLRVLVLFVEVRLELDLARLRNTPAAAEPRETPPAAARSEPSLLPPIEPALPDAQEAGLIPVAESSGSTVAGTRLAEARRFARLVATDIRLYNEEAVLIGRRQRDLAKRLADQLNRGRESFLRRFGDLGPEGLALLDEAYVEVLGAGEPLALQP